MEHEGMVKDILGKFKKAGADAEVFLEENDHLAIDVREGKMENLKRSSSKGMGVRVLYRKKISFVDSTDFSRGSVESLIDKGLSLARMASEDEHNVLPAEVGKKMKPSIFDPSLRKVSIEEKVALAKEVEKKALSHHPLITKGDGCAYEDSSRKVTVANTMGVFEGYDATYCQIKVAVVAEKGESQQPGEYETGSRFLSDLMSVDDIAGNAGYRAVAMVGGEPVKTQKAAVVFDRITGGRLLDGVAEGVNGEQVGLERSFLRGRLGSKIGSDLLNIIDDGIMERGVGSEPNDAEGVATQRRSIVDKGVLKGYLYNSRAASRAGCKSTGNASRFWYGEPPGIGHHNFHMLAGKFSPEEIIRNTRRGLYVLQTLGFGVDAASGGFSIGASGVWIEDGRLAGPVTKVTVASSMLEMLEGIDAVGTDLVPDRRSACPTFRVREMTIGGT